MAEVEYINQGEFDKKVSLLEPVTTKAPTAAISKTYVEKYSVYAKVAESTAPEAIEDSSIRMRVSIEVTTYATNITNQWRIKYNNEDFEILNTQPVFKTPFMKINAIKALK
mgnify:CR=1 FL=1